MSTTYLTGPCLIRRGGKTLYTESGLKIDYKTKTGDVKSDLHGGKIDQYMISRQATLSFKPVDAIGNLASIFALGLQNIGDSIFKAEVTALSIATIATGNPATVTTAADHNLGPVGSTISGTFAGVTGATSTPAINGVQVATITGARTFTIPVNVTVAATPSTGTFTPMSIPLQVVSRNEGMIYTFERSGLLKPPGIHLGASKGFFSGDMQFAALGSYTKAPTDANYWRSAVSASFADADFDETKIKRYRYTAAFGDDTDLQTISAQEGFDLTIDMATQEIPDDNVGVGDIILTSLTAAAKFIPSNLSQAQVDGLLNLQGANALLPGDSISGPTKKALVITGEDASSGFVATLNAFGFADGQSNFATAKLRHGELSGMSRRTWTTGAADELYTLEITTP